VDELDEEALVLEHATLALHVEVVVPDHRGVRWLTYNNDTATRLGRWHRRGTATAGGGKRKGSSRRRVAHMCLSIFFDSRYFCSKRRSTRWRLIQRT
jgi:hypothetical protein